MTSVTLRVDKLEKGTAAALEAALLGVPGVQSVDSWKGRAEVRGVGLSAVALLRAAAAAGFSEASVVPATEIVYIDGMTCRSCELAIEREFTKVSGVSSVNVNASTGKATITGDGTADLAAIGDAARRAGYSLRSEGALPSGGKTSFVEAVLLFAAALALGAVLTRSGSVGAEAMFGDGVTFAGAALIGLVAGSSSCMAVAGGVLLSAVGTYRRRYGGTSGASRMTPAVLFSVGRLASYALFGAIIGAVGNALSPSPYVTAAITFAAAFYMLVAGLDMLKLTPRWMAALAPRMPKAFGRHVLDAEGRPHPVMPFALGAATFFLPCGFTQALQLYALSSKSPATGAVVLFGFALGTIPALLALGWASGALKGRVADMFLKFSGALVVVLGLWSFQNAFVLAGHPLRLPSLRPPAPAALAADPNVREEDGVQVVDVRLIGDEPFYEPSNRFTVAVGKPVRLVMHGFGLGCRSVFQIPKAGISKALEDAENVVEFTPDKPGEYAFSCSMGMYPGAIVAVGT